METLSTISTFEHCGGVVYVNAYRSVVDGWTVNATVVGRADSDGAGNGPAASAERPELLDVAELAGLRFSTREEAVAAGSRIARDYLDRRGS